MSELSRFSQDFISKDVLSQVVHSDMLLVPQYLHGSQCPTINRLGRLAGRKRLPSAGIHICSSRSAAFVGDNVLQMSGICRCEEPLEASRN